MAKNSQDNNYQDDQVLAKLYKEGAKESPPAKLNSEILNYAANANKSATENNHVGSHFGGGWKVPLSMAASVVVVFALLVQLDQSPQQLELPPIPELSVPTKETSTKSQSAPNEYNEERNEAEDVLANDASSFNNDNNESDIDSQNSGALIIDNPNNTKTQSATDSIQTKPVIIKQDTVKNSSEKITEIKAEKKVETSRERIQPQIEATTAPSAPTSSPSSNITKSKPEALTKSQATQRQTPTPEPAKDRKNITAPSASSGAASPSLSGSVMQKRSMGENRNDSRISSDMAADAELAEELSDEQVQTETEFAPIPVEDWLLMIEKLVAQKDYAEAARQLQKFKQAHPKVNVQDLESKIP